MKAIFVLLLVSVIARSAQASEWQLVWSDSFDKPGLPDPAKWGYEQGFVRNHESQFYTKARKENARVENGMLVIEARKEHYVIPKDDRRYSKGRDHAEYTSASLTTKGKSSWTYGRIEVGAKLPAGRGMWPAIWTLGANENQVGWPRCGEIDIMENVGFNPDSIHGTIHAPKSNKGSQIAISKNDQEFHDYAVEWRPDRIAFFVDKTNYFTYKNDGKGEGTWPFSKPEYLILNIAVGGEWGGQKGIDDRVFPQRMYVKYVRVYRDRDAKVEGPTAKN